MHVALLPVHPPPAFNPVNAPEHIDIDRSKGLTIRWADGSSSFYPVTHLRRLSPSADMRELRAQMKKNPLTVLPSRPASTAAPLTITTAELAGNYALKIVFSDGHSAGIYTWDYLRQIAPDADPSAADQAKPPT
jgi:DUF971 family protein